MARKIRKDDQVIVLAGKYKDLQTPRKVLQVLIDKQKVLVEGVTCKKHVKQNPNAQEQGGIKDIPMPLHISNVGIYNVTTQKVDRVGFKEVNGKKVRVFRSNDEQIEQV
jgi:large subunit ribosomal protein L24